MRIDAHNHFWKYDPVRDAWITDEMSVLRKDYLPKEFSEILKENNIDGAIAVQADQSEQETQFLLDLAEDYTQMLGVVGWVDFRKENVGERLNWFSSFERLVGFRHIVQAEPDENFMLTKEFRRGISQLDQFGFTYDILIFPNQLIAALQLVKHFPYQKFVIDHLAKPYIAVGEITEWKKSITAISACPNVSCKLSGIITEADWNSWTYIDLKPYLDVAVEAFGTDRIIFGSDWPVCLLAGSYNSVLGILETYFKDYTEDEKSKVFGDNAAEFYSIT